jgi:signal transduction histidine kinase
MVLVGFAWFLGPVYASDSPLVFTLGIVASGLWGPVFGQLLLSFPTGRLPTRARRRLVAASYVVIPLAPVPALLVSDADQVITDCRGGCPDNVLLVERDQGLGDAALALGSVLTLGLCLVAVGMLIRQWRAASEPERRSLVPLFASGGVTLALVAAYAASQADALLWMAFAAFAATPFAFLAGLARAEISGSRGVRTLMAQLADAPEHADLRDALARALGDPALELAFWMPELDRYVDAAGSPAEMPDDDDARRKVTVIDHHGQHIAAIVHDRAQDTETVRAAGAAAALMLENRRLDAELRARLVELRASRARLVEAADGERRRIERDLHDGAQSRLVALALNLRLARMSVTDGTDTAALLDGSIDELGKSLKELRDLARGIHPAVLSERGLEPAVRDLAARAPVPVDIVGDAAGRLPAAVETAAYFVVSEALTNVSKYARARHATVRVERAAGQLVVEVSDDGVGGADARGGSGLRGLADRVAALSGTLEVTSPPGRGTRLRAQLPCP